MENQKNKLDVRLFYALSAAFLALAFLIVGSGRMAEQKQNSDEFTVQQTSVCNNVSAFEQI